MSDLFNGVMEFIASLFIFHSCYCLYRDKKVHGISVPSIVFFTSWSIWNVYYYYQLNQPYSFYLSLLIPFFNIIWISLFIYYKLNKHE